MNNNMKTDPAKQQEQFTQGCHYIGMKLLAEQYHSVVEKAGRILPGTMNLSMISYRLKQLTNARDMLRT